ncbi:MAG: hypothetical protein M1823_002458 [Watsoniomyces obsoletus]|nr:MAG: hypothetical protein M1823_002458 [Watsoniomyces obsoletus]
MAVQATWALQETATNLITISKDALRVATEENIQPIALFAAEQFGATIAMCPQTRKKVEMTLQETAEPVMVSFLKAQIGFAKRSSITELSKSLAGVNFLALATALVSSMKNYEAGDALWTMITATASDKTLVPTAHQLTALVGRIEPRLAHLGFTNEILGWKTWWNSQAGVGRRFYPKPHIIRPSAEEIHDVVDAFRGLERVGDTQSVVLHAVSCVPWLTAFTKWCLGIEPNIKCSEGRFLLEQPSSPVTVHYHGRVLDQDEAGDGDELYCEEAVTVETLSTTQRLPNLFRARNSTSDDFDLHDEGFIRGMITISNHGQERLREIRDRWGDLGRRALLEVLPYAIRQIRSKLLHVDAYGPFEAALGPDPVSESIELEPLLSGTGCAFPVESVVAEVASLYLSIQPFTIQTLPKGMRIMDLPLFRLWAEDVLGGIPSADPTPHNLRMLASYSSFLKDLSDVLATIFCLSLLRHSLRNIHLYFQPVSHSPYLEPMNTKGSFEDAIYSLLSHGGLATISVEAILVKALDLLGHEVKEDAAHKNWAISSFHGQVVFPKLFESTNNFDPVGFLELLCVPGELYLKEKGIRVRTVGSKPRRGSLTPDDLDNRNLPPPTVALNLYPPRADLCWIVSTYGDLVSANLSWTESECRINPFCILTGLSKALVAKDCPHPASNPMPDSRPSPLTCRFASPTNFEPTDDIKVVPTKGQNGLRIFSLAASEYADAEDDDSCVLMGNACLECALKFCRLVGFSKIIC